MPKIQQIIMSKKFFPVFLVLTGTILFLAFQSQGKSEDNPKSKNEKIIQNVGMLLEEGHLSPRIINDDFSKLVMKRFLEDLDEDKTIFLQIDIDSFKKFEIKIDNEIHGQKLESFYLISQSYTRRLQQSSGYFKNILSKPFDFTKDENIVLDGDKIIFPITENDKKEVWRKRLKYLVLSRYSDMVDDREKNKVKSTTKTPDNAATKTGAEKEKFVYKADSTLEREARGQVLKQIERYFTTLKSHNTSDELFSSFINAITGAMDPHTNYFAPVDSRGFNEMMSGKFYGIGAQLKEEQSKIKIASLISGGPAWKSGDLGVDDEIIKIGQAGAEAVDVTGYGVTDAVKLIRGADKGSEVRLTVRKPDGSTKIVSLKRDEIKLDDTFAKSAIIKGEHKIGYIYLPEFYFDFEDPKGSKCSDDVAKEVIKLKAENVEGIVLDLRGNGGGSLPEVVKMAGLFIEDGPICQVKGRDEKQAFQWKDRDKSILYDGPLTVMVDEFSASASEIFAAAIQDYKRGIVVGSTSTYGKGTVQRTIPLNPESENLQFVNKSEDLGTVKLTLQKFYRVNGGATQLRGVVPDVIIPDRLELAKSREKDNDAALAWDEIAKSDYKLWTSNYSTDLIVASAKEQVKNNMTFKKMREKIDSIDKDNTKAYSLNFNKYQLSQKKLKLRYRQLEDLLKLPTELSVKNTEIDNQKLSADKDKAEKNKRFLNTLKNDIYINEAVIVTNKMISQSTLARQGKFTPGVKN